LAVVSIPVRADFQMLSCCTLSGLMRDRTCLTNRFINRIS
jgi:hypothetical protein